LETQYTMLNKTTYKQSAATREIRDPVGVLLTLLTYHSEWRVDNYNLTHISGISLWYCSGFWFLHERSSLIQIHFTFFEKLRLWPHVKRCVKVLQTDRLTRLTELVEKA
jgi:hypothetical protein